MEKLRNFNKKKKLFPDLLFLDTPKLFVMLTFSAVMKTLKSRATSNERFYINLGGSKK